MGLLVDAVALILVLAVCVAAVGWLHERFRRPGFLRRRPADACPECDGVGAVRGLGALHPCPACDGTGQRVGTGR